MQRLKEAAEKAKIELSGLLSDQHQPALYHARARRAGASGHDLTRAKFNELTADLVEATMGPTAPGPRGCRAHARARSTG